MADIRSKVVSSTNQLKEQLLEAVERLQSSNVREKVSRKLPYRRSKISVSRS